MNPTQFGDVRCGLYVAIARLKRRVMDLSDKEFILRPSQTGLHCLLEFEYKGNEPSHLPGNKLLSDTSGVSEAGSTISPALLRVILRTYGVHRSLRLPTTKLRLFDHKPPRPNRQNDRVPFPSRMSEQTYRFNVSMSCGGCSGAVERVLKKLEGKSAPHPPLCPPFPLFLPHLPVSCLPILVRCQVVRRQPGKPNCDRRHRAVRVV